MTPILFAIMLGLYGMGQDVAVLKAYAVANTAQVGQMESSLKVQMAANKQEAREDVGRVERGMSDGFKALDTKMDWLREHQR